VVTFRQPAGQGSRYTHGQRPQCQQQPALRYRPTQHVLQQERQRYQRAHLRRESGDGGGHRQGKHGNAQKVEWQQRGFAMPFAAHQHVSGREPHQQQWRAGPDFTA